jgi:uncharacterized protein (TIGR03435 family)
VSGAACAGALAPAVRITYTNVTLFNVLLRAYNVTSYQLNAPDWMSSQRYDIAAKIPAGTNKELFERMLQTWWPSGSA